VECPQLLQGGLSDSTQLFVGHCLSPHALHRFSMFFTRWSEVGVKLPISCASNLAAPKKKYRVFVIQVPLHSVEIYMTIHRYIFPNDGVDPGNVKEKGGASSCEMQLPDVLSNWEDHSVYGH